MTSDCPHAITCQSEIMLHFVHQSASQSRLLLRLHPLTLTALMGIMLQGTLPVEARTCRTGTPSRLFAAAAVLPHFGIACQGPATPRITRSVRVVTESSPSRHRVVTESSPELQFLLLQAKHGCRNRPQWATPGQVLPSSEPGLRQMPYQAVAEHHCNRLRHDVDMWIFSRPVGQAGFIWVSSGFHLFELSKLSQI